MKTIEVFCASPASTAICSSTDHRAIIRHGMRSVHRLGETPRSNGAPCSSHLPFDPSRKSASSSSSKHHPDVSRRKSSADVHDLAATPRRRLLAPKPLSDFISDSKTSLIPSRPLPGETHADNKRSNPDAFPAFRSLSTRSHESPVFSPSSSAAGKLIDHLNAQRSSFTPLSRHQVVELRVSIHCKGCEGKLRKHISRMEGVTSFSIDLETKKVTVIGNVTPVSVLTSISKVKNAQFWPSPASSSSSSSSPSPRITTFITPRVSLTR